MRKHPPELPMPDRCAHPPGQPRRSLPFDGKLVIGHRLIRRGLPYGPPLPEGASDDDLERGVMFASFQADLERQFEFVQSQWINDGNAFGLSADKDRSWATMTAPASSRSTERPPRSSLRSRAW
jgi:hypothetical protein